MMYKGIITKMRKEKRAGRKRKPLGAIIALVVIAAIIAGGVYYYYEQQNKIKQEQWISSGPFSINKNEYKLGEYVFMSVQGLKPTDVGSIIIVDPKGDVYDHIPFNGTMKSSFNQFFKPNTQRTLALCTPESLVGNWTLAFQGVSYKSIPFKVINDWIPGAQAEIKPVPKGLDPC
jgi:hypothetical protein